ncbi:hypothetical protein [Aquipuribacter sp. SD81]|uniref:hypothetical protein n=1 Tax=Aquipuribacter sp. SD81 TaxID=3127703 RepID=UPI0030175B90
MKALAGTRHRRGDEGAVAVFTAILAVVLFVVCAMAVEFTNLWSTDRASQKTVDLAATSAAQFLPDMCAAAREARANLNDNPIPDSAALPSLSVLLNGDVTDGEIQILTSMEAAPPPFGTNTAAARGAGAWLDARGCSDATRPTVEDANAAQGRARMVRVMAPLASIPLQFSPVAEAEPVGATAAPRSAYTRRMATAGIVGSSRGVGYGLMPVAMPEGCLESSGFGPTTILVGQENNFDGINWTARNNNGANGPLFTTGLPDVSETTVASGSARVSVTVNRLALSPTTASATAPGAVVFDFHTFGPLGSLRAVAEPPAVALQGAPFGTAGNFSATFIITLPSAMANSPGIWLVRAAQPNATGNANNRRWTPDSEVAEIFVIGDAAQEIGCDEPNRGNFGMIRTERRDGRGNDVTTNMALGMDHSLSAFPTPPGPASPTCDGEDIPSGARRDLTPTGGPVDNANCSYILPGSPDGKYTQGLVTGIPGSNPRIDGRLARTSAVSVPNSCTDPASSGDYLWRTPTHGRVQVINTVLSCYLLPGASLSGAIAESATTPSFSEDIYGDPRFFFVPVFDTSERPGSAGNYYAIKRFVGAFITSQQEDGTVPSCTNGRKASCNGLQFGGTQLNEVTIFTFPLVALPPTTETPVQEGPDGFEDYIGGTKEVVLYE